MNLATSHQDTAFMFTEAVSAPCIKQETEDRAADCPVHLAQQAARAELMLLRGVTSSDEYVRRLGVDDVEAADAVLAVVRTKWASGDNGVPGRGRQLAALDLASNRMMLDRIFRRVRGRDRDDTLKRHAENRRERAELLDRSPRLQVVTVTTPARITLASGRFRSATAGLDRMTIAAEIMIERSELIQTDTNGNLGVVRVAYTEA